MTALRISLATLVLATACCCCCGLTDLFGTAPEFTTGDFADVPVYPGATQTTESNVLFNTMMSVFNVFGDVEWKHYLTEDSEYSVLGWYEENLPDYGWELTETEQSDSTSLTFESTDDPMLMLAVMTVGSLDLESDDTHILIGRIHIFGE